MVASSAIQTPIPKPNATAAFVDPATGNLTQHGVTMLQQWYARMVGTSRLIPCAAAGTNVITLTPLDPPPLLEKYDDYDTFVFVAAATSTGAVTATVAPKAGALSTIKVYKTGGSAQAGSGDVVSGSIYMAIFNDALDTGNGGFVLK